MKKTVGIDVSKSELDIFCDWNDIKLKVKNTAAGRKKLCKILSKDTPNLVVLEATGIYHRAILRELNLADIKVCLANPKRARDFAKAVGVLAKTDQIDAMLLARYGSEVNLKPSKPISIDQEALLI